jgi:oxygen-dependent protoporphyrinogen oxidase
MSSYPFPPSAFPVRRIAVIGGGISGLAAAHRLTELLPQAEIVLFEAAGRLGGVLDTVERDGYLVERSADNFLVKPPAGVELCESLGISGELVATDETRRRAFVVRGGKLIPIPDGFYLMSPRKLGPLLTSRVLSPLGKLRMLAEWLIPPRPNADPTAQNPGDDESVASFARRRLGREAFENLVQPLVAGIYTADPEKLSMAAAMPQFLNYERTYGSLLGATLRHAHSAGDGKGEGASGARYGLFVAPNRGMVSFVRAIADYLPRTNIQLNTRVRQLRRTRLKWDVIFDETKPGQVPATSFDAVICAAPAFAAAAMLSDVDRALASELAAIEYAGCAVVSLGFARERIGHSLDGFGFVVPQGAGRRIIAGSFASLKFPGRAPAEHVLFRVFVGGALQPELLGLSDHELVQVARDELTELLQISGEPLLADIARWPRSMPQYHVGHLDRVRRIERLAAAHPRFALAGNAYRGVGIPQCITSGQAAAERIAAGFSAAP